MITLRGQIMRFFTDKLFAVRGGRLFWYDGRIAINATRATFPYWRDRLLALVVLLIALFGLRAWFVDRSWSAASWHAYGAGLMVGLGAARLIHARLIFHASDGPLAADALRSGTRWRYILAWHMIGFVILALVTIFARPLLVLASLPGYVTGAFAAYGAGAVMPARRSGSNDARRHLMVGLRHPLAAVVSATVLLVPLATASSSIHPNMLAAISGIEAALLMLALTAIDDRLVLFLAIAGHRPGATILRQGRTATIFLALAVSGAFFVLGATPAAAVAAVGIAALLLMAIRTLAYRVHRKRVADFIILILTTVMALTVFAAPLLLPVVACIALWRLYRMADAKTWMLQ